MPEPIVLPDGLIRAMDDAGLTGEDRRQVEMFARFLARLPRGAVVSRGQKRRTPQYFPTMKYRARARRIRMIQRATYDFARDWWVVQNPRGRHIITAEELYRGGVLRIGGEL